MRPLILNGKLCANKISSQNITQAKLGNKVKAESGLYISTVHI